MSSEDEIKIRPYKPTDKKEVRIIAVETAFMGNSGEVFFTDREILADGLTGYYLNFEPQSSFVAESQNKIAGYLLGCLSTKRYQRIFNYGILPRLILRSLCRGLLFQVKIQRFIYYALRSWLRGEFSRPDFSLEYPAHLHINIAAPFRNHGIGTKLVELFFNYLKKNGVSGLHAWTMAEGGKHFFRNLGFNLLYDQKVTYFDYLLRRELRLNCFGKKI
jgi:ribosomal protein S18 acetylase RimI-like enzyme